MNTARVVARLIRHLPITMALSGYLLAQGGGPVGTDLFFLDLGIVIEPGTGKEEVNRLVKAPPERVKFFLDKAPSGSVFIASTKEMQHTLDRISHRIETLETAFEKEVGTLREENDELRDMIADLMAREPIIPPVNNVRVSRPEPLPVSTAPVDAVAVAPAREESREERVSDETKSVVSHEEPDLAVKKKRRPFNRMVYMNAVFAYQREDFSNALRYFGHLSLQEVDEVTAGNVLYWTADCHYQMGEYREALNTLRDIGSLFNSDKRDDAMILTGLAFRQLGNELRALEAFASIVDEHPDSEYLKLAQMELRNAAR